MQDKEVQTLSKLGLTHRQAMVYLCLVKSGLSSIKTISQGTDIARQHIYHIISQLSKMGLVEKALTSPVKFKATPMQVGLSCLMENKNREHNKLQTETTELLNNLKRYNIKTAPQKEDPQFVLLSGKKPILSKLKEAKENTHKTIDAIVPWQICKTLFYQDFAQLKKCLDKGVHFRHIIDVAPEKDQFQKVMKNFWKYSSFEIRYSSSRLPVTMSIYDKKVVQLSSTLLTPTETPDLMITNFSLVSLLNDYFEMVWTKAIEPI